MPSRTKPADRGPIVGPVVKTSDSEYAESSDEEASSSGGGSVDGLVARGSARASSKRRRNPNAAECEHEPTFLAPGKKSCLFCGHLLTYCDACEKWFTTASRHALTCPKSTPEGQRASASMSAIDDGTPPLQTSDKRDRRKDEASTDMPEEKKAKREVSSTSSKASVAKRRVVDSVMQQAIAAQQASMGQGGMGQAAMGHRQGEMPFGGPPGANPYAAAGHFPRGMPNPMWNGSHMPPFGDGGYQGMGMAPGGYPNFPSAMASSNMMGDMNGDAPPGAVSAMERSHHAMMQSMPRSSTPMDNYHHAASQQAQSMYGGGAGGSPPCRYPLFALPFTINPEAPQFSVIPTPPPGFIPVLIAASALGTTNQEFPSMGMPQPGGYYPRPGAPPRKMNGGAGSKRTNQQQS